MSTITPTASAQDLPGEAVTTDQNGTVITTEWGGSPVIPTDLPDGFSCTIINYSQGTWTSNELAAPMFVLTNTNFNDPATSVTLEAGQSFVMTAASVLASQGGNEICYFIAKGS